MARVSVVIPVYNIAEHLRQCLDSVTAQTLAELEIICVDDGSTDESPAILAEYARRDGRIQVITQANAGPGAARNAGMARAAGEYLIFLDSDDWLAPDLLEGMAARAHETGADITICRGVEFDTHTGRELPSGWMLKTQYLPGGVFAPEDAADHLFQFTYGWPWDKLYRMEFVRRERLAYPPLRNSEDLVFVFQSLAAAKKLAILDETLIHHRVNRKASVSNSRHLHPDVPYQALMLFREGLRERGVYPRFERSFLNWAMEFLVWNAANTGSRAAQRDYLFRLKRDWFPALDFDKYPRGFYRDRAAYCKYLLAKHAPYPVFRAVVNTYKGAKRITAAGRRHAAPTG